MKTKEQIIEYAFEAADYYEAISVVYQTAMDEFAKQQSVEFGEWKDKYFKTTYPIDGKMYTLKYYSPVKESGSTFGTHYNIPELYEIFNKIQHNQ